MSKYIKQLEKYFENTPKEQLEKDWKEIKHLNKIGYSIEDYIKFYKNERKS